MMDKEISRKTMRIYLYIGLLLFVGGNLIRTFFSEALELKAKAISDLSDMAYESGWYLTFLSACVLAPVLEELTFRLWVKKSKSLRWVSFVFLLITILAVFHPIAWWFASLLVVLMGLILFLPVLKNIRIHLLFISTSVLFGVMHWENYELGLGSFFYFSVLIGMGFVFAYLGKRFGFRYSILGHFLNNLWAISLMLYATITFPTLEGNTEKYTYRLKGVDFVQASLERKTPELLFNGSPTAILTALSPVNNDTVFLADKESELLTQLEIFGDTSHIDLQALKQQLLNKLQPEQVVKRVDAYTLIPEQQTLASDATTTSREDLLSFTIDPDDYKLLYVEETASSFIHYLWKHFELPIVLDRKADPSSTIYIDADFYTIIHEEKVIEFLSKENGFGLSVTKETLPLVKYKMK